MNAFQLNNSAPRLNQTWTSFVSPSSQITPNNSQNNFTQDKLNQISQDREYFSGNMQNSGSSAAAEEANPEIAVAEEALKVSNGVADTITNAGMLNQSGAYQSQYYQNLSGHGQFGNSMSTGLHSNMLLAAQNQTLAERANIVNGAGTLFGPLGKLIAYGLSGNYQSGQESDLNFQTALDNSGRPIDPDTQSNYSQNINRGGITPEDSSNSVLNSQESTNQSLTDTLNSGPNPDDVTEASFNNGNQSD